MPPSFSSTSTVLFRRASRPPGVTAFGKVLADGRNFQSGVFRGLGNYPGLPVSALLAKKVSEWDVRGKKACRRTGTLDAFIAKLANQGGLFQDWQKIFQRLGRGTKVTGVEKVSVAKAGDLPYFEQLKAGGINADDRVPSDAVVWLAVFKN